MTDETKAKPDHEAAARFMCATGQSPKVQNLVACHAEALASMDALRGAVASITVMHAEKCGALINERTLLRKLLKDLVDSFGSDDSAEYVVDARKYFETVARFEAEQRNRVKIAKLEAAGQGSEQEATDESATDVQGS